MSRLLLLVLSLSFCAACAPDLGDAPFFCNVGVPECPSGYVCRQDGQRGICVREGQPIPTPDISIPDAGPGVDQGPPIDQGPGFDQGNPSIRIVVSEVHANPAAVGDVNGEYIELFNAGSTAINLNGWTLKDDANDNHVISGTLIIQPNSFITLARNSNSNTNGGVPVDYQYADFDLANTADEIILLDPAAVPVFTLRYSPDKNFAIPNGASISIKNPTQDPSNGDNWCIETSPWSGSAGDKGTPKGPPGCS